MNARIWRKVSLSIGATVGLLALVWLVGTALAQGPEGGETLEGDVSLAATVADKINYQGRLTDSGGTPLDGTFSMRFQIYDSAAGFTMLWDSGIVSVEVDGGLFNVELDVDPADFNGQALWLRIYVDGDWLTPRQELLPVPYALSLRPGAEIEGQPMASVDWLLNVNVDGYDPAFGGALRGFAATGSGIRGESDGGYGALGSSTDNHGVWGDSENKCGVYGTSTDNHGVYGRSENREGGFFVSVNHFGVHGKGEGGWPGVFGESESSSGVSGTSTDSNGVYGFSEDGNGVHGYSSNDYGGYFSAWDYRGLYVNSGAGWYDAVFDGTTGINVGATVYGGDLYSRRTIHAVGDITAGGSKAGYVVDIALNHGPDSLELGDVVVITGAAEPILGSIPVPRVQKASDANSTGVIGVVDRRFVAPSGDVRVQETEAESPGYFEDSSISIAEGGGIAPGEYVGVVTLGSFRAIKVDASYGAIQPGDLLVSSHTPGYAMKASPIDLDGVEIYRPGTVIGKALGWLDSGTGVIPVLVTLQ